MLLTVCTISQLPDALTLGSSFGQHHPGEPFLIGLADDPALLPVGYQCPYPLLSVVDCMTEDVLALSAKYTPTEFVAACKPTFIRAAFSQYPAEQYILYADPETYIYQPLTAVFDQLQSATALLVPHITRPPGDTSWPDEKALQNVGLYSAGFLAFRRTAETDRLLAWWQDRVTTRAFIDPCEGLCTDQLWLMYWPAFFDGIRIVKDAGWQLALWNIHERQLTQASTGWQVNGKSPLLFADFRGLINPDVGFFSYQNRFRLTTRADVRQLLADYQTSRRPHEQSAIRTTTPAFGSQPEPVVLRGWRQSVATAARAVTSFIDWVPLPVFR